MSEILILKKDDVINEKIINDIINDYSKIVLVDHAIKIEANIIRTSIELYVNEEKKPGNINVTCINNEEKTVYYITITLLNCLEYNKILSLEYSCKFIHNNKNISSAVFKKN